MTAPQPLVDDIKAGRCLPFIGAGFSVNAKLPIDRKMPAWAGLTSRLAEIARVSPDLGGPMVASEFEKLFGRVQLIEAIRKSLHVGYAEPGEAHSTFAELPFDTIYTTNFDLLLEDAFQHLKKPFRSIVGELQMPFHGGLLTTSIVKMHGDLRHEEHIIVTTEDYSRYVAAYPVIATHLAAQLITKTALFIGYSLTDPDFINIREVVRTRLGRFQRMAYVLAFDARADEVASKLGEHIHVISLSTATEPNRVNLLTTFFRDIQHRLDVEEGEKFRAARPEIFGPVTAIDLKRASSEPDAASLLASSSNLCFVMMPFGESYNSVYQNLIRPVIEKFGLTAIRADEMYTSGSIMEQIRVAIQQSRVCVADVSERNPNVLYEVGIAHTLGKPAILLTRDIRDVAFDLKGLRAIIYNMEDVERFRGELYRSLEVTLGEDRVDEARRLIDGGMYRAAAGLLGVVLEHDLRRLISLNSGIAGEIARRPLGIGEAIAVLSKVNLLAAADQALLREAWQIRNRAVHVLEEPSRDQVRLMLDAVQTFRRKYLRETDLNDPTP